MTNSSYQTAGSIPLSAVMVCLVVFVQTTDEAVKIMPEPSMVITPGIRSTYVSGNAAMTISFTAGLTGDSVVDNYRPRTALGHKLLALRREYLNAGGQLLDSDSLDIEMQSRRGGVADA